MAGNEDLYFTGHSKGGSEATFYATWLMNDRERYKKKAAFYFNRNRGDDRKNVAEWSKVNLGGPVRGLYPVAPSKTGNSQFEELQHLLMQRERARGGFEYGGFVNNMDLVPLSPGKYTACRENSWIDSQGRIYPPGEFPKERPKSLAGQIFGKLFPALRDHKSNNYARRFFENANKRPSRRPAAESILRSCYPEKWLKQMPGFAGE